MMSGSGQAVQRLFDTKDTSMSDAVFDVLTENGASEKIPVHKLILSMRSPVFFAMFYGPMADRKTPPDAIEIDDIKAETFKVMLRYIYNDRDEDFGCVNKLNVFEILYAANKYDIEFLRSHCVRVAAESLTSETVFRSIEKAVMFDCKSLLTACYTFIDKNTKAVLGSKSFLQQSGDVVGNILERPTLAEDGVTEACIYTAVFRWAVTEADRSYVAGTSDGVRARAVLGKTAYDIRFTSMEPQDIAKAVEDEFLSVEESGQLLAVAHKVPGAKTEFVTAPRTGRERANRVSEPPVIRRAISPLFDRRRSARVAGCTYILRD